MTGLDQSTAMIAQADRSEAAEPLGIRYLVGDAATDRSVVGTCDLVLGNYLLPYAFTPEALLAMCTTARAALAGPGRRFVAVTPNPDMPTTLPGSYQKYGVEVAADGTAPSDGDILRVRARVGGCPLDLTACHWSRARYEWALTGAGFAEVTWVRMHCGADGDVALYADLVAAPHLLILIATV